MFLAMRRTRRRTKSLSMMMTKKTWTTYPALPTAAADLNEDPVVDYDLMTDLLHTYMFKVISDMLRSESLRIQ
jgi:hypothetical protein